MLPALISSLHNQSSTGTVLFFEMSKAVLQNAAGNRKKKFVSYIFGIMVSREGNLHFR